MVASPNLELISDSETHQQSELVGLTVLEALPVAVGITRPANAALLYANPRLYEQFRIPRELLRLPATADLYVHPEDRQRLLERLRRDGAVEGYPVLMRRLDGSSFWDLISIAETSFAGQPALVSCHHDISDHKITEMALQQSEERHALVSRGVNDGIWDWNLLTGDITLSPRLVDMLFADPTLRVLNAEDWFEHVHPEDLPQLRAAIAGHLAGETASLDIEYRMQPGQIQDRWLHCRGVAMRDAAEHPTRMAGSQSDITARKQAEQRLERAAYVDPLTGLSNRTRFLEQLAAAGLGKEAGTSAVLVVSLAKLKRLSDTLGQKVTQGVLIAVAQRLDSARHPDELLARIDTDEFALLLTGESALDARWRATEIWRLLAEPIIVGDTEFEMGIRIGMASSGLGAQTGEEMVSEAHLALEWSTFASEGAVFVFDETMRPQQRRRSQLETDLPGALRDGEIFVEYQPVLTLADSRLVAFEALARWRHPEIGLVPPIDFIPIAEQSGLIQRLGHEVLRLAAAQQGDWREHGLDSSRISVAINFSASQLADRRSVRNLISFLDAIPAAERHLNLELTKSILLADPDGLVEVLAEIKRHGVGLSLDDFGTGYSSLSYLQKFPFDILKIDRSFCSRLTVADGAESARRLVRSIIRLGHDLGLLVVAEGIETLEERELLTEFGCDAGQGYLFSKPMPASRTLDFLRPLAVVPGGQAASALRT